MTENKTNGKAKEQNGKNGQKVIPKDAWKEFYEYWDNCDWKDLTIAEIKKHLGNGKYVYVPIPKNVTDKTEGGAWFKALSEFREKGKGNFGGFTVCFTGQKATLEQVFGKEPINPAQMTKQLHLYINDHHLSSKASAKTNGKNTVKVNTVEEMEKEVAKLSGKKGK